MSLSNTTAHNIQFQPHLLTHIVGPIPFCSDFATEEDGSHNPFMLQDARIAANLVVQHASIQRDIRCVLAYL
jgi:hypothetical protein